MAELKKYFIRSANELAAMGKIAYDNEEGIQNAIKDIDYYMENILGMPKVGTTIDYNNMVFNDLITKATQYNNINTGSTFTYGTSTFAFTDELQETRPIFIKFNYQVMQIAFKYNHVNCKNSFAFTIYASIINGENKSIKNFQMCNIAYSSYSSELNNVSQPGSNAFNTIEMDSYGFYNKNRLYINIYPQRRVVGSKYYIDNNIPTTQQYAPYCSFYIERFDDYIAFVNLVNGVNTSNTGGAYSIGKSVINMDFISYDGLTVYSSNTGSAVPFGTRQIMNNLNATYKILYINPITNIVESTGNLLSYYSPQANKSGLEFEVPISENELGKYVNVATEDNLRYLNSTSYGFLIRYD